MLLNQCNIYLAERRSCSTIYARTAAGGCHNHALPGSSAAASLSMSSLSIAMARSSPRAAIACSCARACVSRAADSADSCGQKRESLTRRDRR
eukprot:COSAG01_NODE_2338_length_7873_cov_25.961538_5_plen_93_part_00